MKLRELVFSIGWTIDERHLKKANRLTDNYVSTINDADRSITNLGDEINNLGRRGERSFDDLEQSANDVRHSVESIRDPRISTRQTERELNDVITTSERVEQSIRGIPDPDIDSSNARRELQRMEDQLNELEEQLKRMQDESNGFGDVLGGIGAGVAGASAVGLMSSVESSASSLETRLGVSREKAEGLRREALDVFENNFGQSIGETTLGVELVYQITNAEGDELQEQTQDLFRITDAWGQDTREVVDAVRAHASSMGIGFNEALDVVGTGFQDGLNISEDFLDTVREFSPSFNRIGADSGEMLSILDKGLELGIRDTDRMADSINEFGILIQEVDAEKQNEALYDLGKAMGKTDEQALNFAKTLQNDFFKGGDSALETTNKVVESLNGLSPDKKEALGIQFFGTMWEDTSGQVGQAILNAKDSTTELIDVTKDLNDQYDTASNNIQGFGRSLLGNVIAPLEDLGVNANTAIQGVTAIGTSILALRGLGFGGIFGKIGKGFSKAGSIIKKVMSPVVKFGSKIGGLTKSFGGLALRIGSKVLPMIARFAPHLLKLGGPIGWIASAVIMLGTTIYKNWDWITAKTSALGESIGNVMGSIGGVIKGTWDTAVGVVKSRVNTIIDVVNSMIKGINGIEIDVPQWVGKIPGIPDDIQSFGFDIPEIPHLAKGGLATDATVAMIGEGKDEEAVLPLNNEVFKRIGEGINNQYKPSKQETNYNNQNPVFNSYVTIEGRGMDDEQLVNKINQVQERNHDKLMDKYFRIQQMKLGGAMGG